MAGLYIPNWKKFDTCDKCPCTSTYYDPRWDETTLDCVLLCRTLDTERFQNPDFENVPRPDDCPLIFLEDHGDLIDRDKVLNLDRNIYCDGSAVGIRSGILPYQIEMMRAVIPSDKKTE